MESKEERNPRNHADDVGGEERHGADQEQDNLHADGADVEGEEIGGGEAEDCGDRPDDRRRIEHRICRFGVVWPHRESGVCLGGV